MLSELSSAPRTVGVKQSRRAIREGRARKVFLARDAEERITAPVAEECAAAGVVPVREFTMAQLGRAARISVGASVVALLRDTP